MGSLAPGVRSFGSARPGYPPAPPSTSREEDFRRPFGIHSSQPAFMSSERLPSSAPLYSASAAGSSIRGRAARCFLTPPPTTGFQGPYVAPAWDDPPSLAYGYPEEDPIPPDESNLYSDDPADKIFAVEKIICPLISEMWGLKLLSYFLSTWGIRTSPPLVCQQGRLPPQLLIPAFFGRLHFPVLA